MFGVDAKVNEDAQDEGVKCWSVFVLTLCQIVQPMKVCMVPRVFELHVHREREMKMTTLQNIFVLFVECVCVCSQQSVEE